MKLRKITQKEIDEFTRNENGIKECPGFSDYSEIKSFGEWSSFGEGSSFGERSSFGKGSSFGEGSFFENGKKALHPFFIRINNIGSRHDGCMIFNFEEGIYIRSGCYFGSESDFIQRVKEVHQGNKYEKEYLLALELARIAFSK